MWRLGQQLHRPYYSIKWFKPFSNIATLEFNMFFFYYKFESSDYKDKYALSSQNQSGNKSTNRKYKTN